MMRLGLCCVFRDQPIKFRDATARRLGSVSPRERSEIIGRLVLHNAAALVRAIDFCADNDIGAFRITSRFLPLGTHPELGYSLDELSTETRRALDGCARVARARDVRLTFHPDQFVVLNSPRDDVVRSSLAEIEHQALLAGVLGADVITVHGGGGYGDPEAALARLEHNLSRLSERARGLLAIENDDRIFAPAQLLPVCERAGFPFVYDVHHHRCNADGHTVEQVTSRAIASWGREPLFHVSSPLGGWDGGTGRKHADMIDPDDFPSEWDGLHVTVEVEAKAKEIAVRALGRALARRGA